MKIFLVSLWLVTIRVSIVFADSHLRNPFNFDTDDTCVKVRYVDLIMMMLSNWMCHGFSPLSFSYLCLNYRLWNVVQHLQTAVKAHIDFVVQTTFGVGLLEISGVLAVEVTSIVQAHWSVLMLGQYTRTAVPRTWYQSKEWTSFFKVMTFSQVIRLGQRILLIKAFRQHEFSSMIMKIS